MEKGGRLSVGFRDDQIIIRSGDEGGNVCFTLTHFASKLVRLRGLSSVSKGIRCSSRLWAAWGSEGAATNAFCVKGSTKSEGWKKWQKSWRFRPTHKRLEETISSCYSIAGEVQWGSSKMTLGENKVLVIRPHERSMAPFKCSSNAFARSQCHSKERERKGVSLQVYASTYTAIAKNAHCLMLLIRKKISGRWSSG